MNNIQILGTITKDPELKYSASGTAILSFSIAYNEKYKKQDGSYEDKAMFFDVTAFGKRGETINQYFRKGSRILINGSLDYQSWTTQDGQKRSKVGIKLNDFDFIDKRDNHSNNAKANQQQPAYDYKKPTYEYQNAQGQQVPAIDVNEDEMPF